MPIDWESCWKWIGAKSEKGYGQLHSLVNGKFRTLIAHRITYELFYGSIPEGMSVCHNCPEGDNPWCVNPKHLWLGTTRENIHDAIYKGRGWWQKSNRPRRHGSISSFAKLTEEQAKEIILGYATGKFCYKDLAKKYNCSIATIGNIVRGLRWSHVRLEMTDTIQLTNNKYLASDWQRKISEIHSGSNNIHAKLKEHQVLQIREEWSRGGEITMASLAKKYNVSPTTIGYIIERKTWTHI